MMIVIMCNTPVKVKGRKHGKKRLRYKNSDNNGYRILCENQSGGKIT